LSLFWCVVMTIAMTIKFVVVLVGAVHTLAEEDDANLTLEGAELAAANDMNSKECIRKLDQDCGLWTRCQDGSDCVWKHCYCNSGTCAGVDDRCHSGDYEYLGTFKISNARWPEYFMTMGIDCF